MGRRKKPPAQAKKSPKQNPLTASLSTQPNQSDVSGAESTCPSTPNSRSREFASVAASDSQTPPWADLVRTAESADQRLEKLADLVVSLAQNVSELRASHSHAADDRDGTPVAESTSEHSFDGDMDTYVDTETAGRASHLEAEVERLHAELATVCAENESLASERDTIVDQYEQAEKDCVELRCQNEELAASVASGQVRKRISEQHTETLSWEERKALIFQQMEDETFDADAFVDEIGKERLSDEDNTDSPSDPLQFVQTLLERLDRAEYDRERQAEEISQLQRSLEENSSVVAGNDGQPMAVGAAALVGLIDGNELVEQERERLKSLQDEWEAKFRQMEVDSSLARAKLSRERQELANKLAAVETELEQARRAGRVEEETGGASRKWLAKLGIE